ncbi:hypothetical protein [Lentzea sp. E54]|uniref:hypothetical protein n=1 Tax=Lentzea xerophila TaxID=3435883 RepID=UPI003DA56348
MATDHWTDSTPGGVIGSIDEGVTVIMRCGQCDSTFGRPRGSSATHSQMDDTVSCAPDAEVNTIEKVGRWRRR